MKVGGPLKFLDERHKDYQPQLQISVSEYESLGYYEQRQMRYSTTRVPLDRS